MLFRDKERDADLVVIDRGSFALEASTFNPRATFTPFVRADGFIDDAGLERALHHRFSILCWQIERR
ncbi:MAG: hypothetical protein WCF24_07650 [Acidimicrobiales bacterium]